MLYGYDEVTELLHPLKNNEYHIGDGKINDTFNIRNKNNELIIEGTYFDFFEAREKYRAGDKEGKVVDPNTGETLLEIYENQRIMAIRDPLIDLSGVRVLKPAKWIRGRKGAGFTVNSFNKHMMSGADNDGDTATIYQGMPHEMLDAFQNKKITFGLSKDYSPSKGVLELTGTPEAKKLTGALEPNKDWFTTMNPEHIVNFGAEAGKGFSLLGKVDMAKKFMKTTLDQIYQGKTDFGHGDYIITPKENSAEKAYKSLSEDTTMISNTAVDAGNIFKVNSYHKILL